MEFSRRETKKKPCEISKRLDFLALKFSRDVTYIMLPNFHGWRFVLPGISRGTEKIKKNQGFFFKRVCPQIPLFFFVIPHSKTIYLNWSYKALSQKEALILCQDRALASFSCVLSLVSVLKRFTHLYSITAHWGEEHPCMENKAPSSCSPTFPTYIFAVNILSKAGEIHSLIAFYKLFLSDIKVKMCRLSPFVRLTPSVFSK